ncbi:hypothetical protein LQT97_09940 [Brucella pseudogrignonensis]|uniref:hypothetical protein n=1 Tax=Brucella pseudogrignonensis TaxID=419475 RepID=UPI001E485BFC|nr:hypothetical protein [Brucella pseudogrignonensis]MCD4511559.1 hypothetical protein [Brucella pseudogrignonensis]
MAAGGRIRCGLYTDSDIIALYLKYREENIGPFVREVGDFLAHPARDRGLALEASRYVYAQLAFFQKFQGTAKVKFETNGTCEWWLRDYFVLKIKDTSEKIIRKKFKITRKEAVRKVFSWFNNEKSFPDKFDCKEHELLNYMLMQFSSNMNVQPPFTFEEMKRQVGRMFARENIPFGEFERFIAGTCVVLSGRSGQIGPGVTASLHLIVDPKPIKTGDCYVSRIDGPLSIQISTRTEDKSSGIVDVGMTLIETNVDSEQYVSRKLIEKNEYGIPRLNLERALVFETIKDSCIQPLE